MQYTAVDNLLAHWSTRLPGVEIRPTEFYAMVENEIRIKGIPRIAIARVYYREGGFWSPKRQYLRISYREFVFDICGFPISNSFAVSWWLGTHNRTVASLLYEIPVLGPLLDPAIRANTFYSMDVDAVCQNAIHESVLNIVDELTHENQLPRLNGPDRVPVLSEFYA